MDLRAVKGVGKHWVDYFPGSEQGTCLRGSVNTGEVLGLNELRGICRPSE
jgi:hypothetical protein